MRGDTHSSRGVDPEEERAKVKPAKSKEMRAEEPARTEEPARRPSSYRTREMKAD